MQDFIHHRYLVKNQISRIAKTRPEPKAEFFNHFFENIDATPEQRKTISPIIKKWAKELHDINIEMREKRKPVLDSMRLDIEPHLHEDQKSDLNKFIKRMGRFQGARKAKRMKRSQPKSN